MGIVTVAVAVALVLFVPFTCTKFICGITGMPVTLDLIFVLTFVNARASLI